MTGQRVRTRSAARAEGVLVASVGGVRVLRGAVEVGEGERERAEEMAKRGGAPIFNPDEKRLQVRVGEEDPLVKRVVKALEEEGLVQGRTVGPAVVLHSLEGCERQPLHTDYDVRAVGRSAAKPLGVLVALQDGTRLGMPEGEEGVELRKGDVAVFDGDQPHAGEAYDKPNTRMHLYLDCPGVHRVPNETYPSLETHQNELLEG